MMWLGLPDERKSRWKRPSHPRGHPQGPEKNLHFPAFYRLTRWECPPIHPASPNAGDELAVGVIAVGNWETGLRQAL